MIDLCLVPSKDIREAGCVKAASWFAAAAEAAAPSPAAAQVLIDSWTTDALAGRVLVLEAWHGPTLLGRVLVETFGDGLAVLAAQRAALGPRLALPVLQELEAWARSRGLGWVLVETHSPLVAIAMEGARGPDGRPLFRRRAGAAFIRRLTDG